MAGKGLMVDEAGRYWLRSPEDSYAVEVEDVPFVISDFETSGNTIILKTNFGEAVPLDATRTFETHEDGAYPTVPYVTVRNGLRARLGRSVLYHLVPLARPQGGRLYIESAGASHCLGELDDNT